MGVAGGRNLDSNLVSVITPVFNAERFIEETIRSAQAQTYRQWEMLVLIDAGSKDRTAEIVKRIASEDPRVKLVDVPGGRNVQDARNYGFKTARGRFVAFLDADDLWLPTKLEKQIALMNKEGAALCYTHFRRVSVDGSEVGFEHTAPLRMTYPELLVDNTIGCPTVVIDQERTGELFMDTNRHEDYALWLRIVRQGYLAMGVPEDLARYRVVPGSRAAKKHVNLARRWYVFRDLEKLPVPVAGYYWVRYVATTAKKYLRF